MFLPSLSRIAVLSAALFALNPSLSEATHPLDSAVSRRDNASAGLAEARTDKQWANASLEWTKVDSAKLDNALKSWSIRTQKKLDAHTLDQLMREFKRKERLQRVALRQMRALSCFINGECNEEVFNDLRSALRTVEATSEWIRLQQREVGYLDPTNFQNPSWRASLLTENLLLASSPRVLQPSSAPMQKLWSQIVHDVQRGRSLTSDDFTALIRALQTWQDAAARDVSELTPRERVPVRRYWRDVNKLICKLSTPEKRKLVQESIRGGEARFMGGTAGQLLEFVMNRRLIPRPGSDAQQHLTEIVASLYASAEKHKDLLENPLQQFQQASSGQQYVKAYVAKKQGDGI